MHIMPKCRRGYTLIELMVSLTIFALLSTITYSTFVTITGVIGKTSDINNLRDRGERILTFMEDDIRMAGFLVGPDAQVPYCTNGSIPGTPNALVKDTGTPYDALTFITSIPIMLSDDTDCMTGQTDVTGASRRDYFLTTRGDSGPATRSVLVDAPQTCFEQDLAKGASPEINGTSLVTFNAVSIGNSSSTFYSYSGATSTSSTPPVTTMVLKSDLAQTIADNATVYSVRQFRYGIMSSNTSSTSRTMRRLSWSTSCNPVPSNLYENSGSLGGVDGLKFEFTSYNTLTNSMVVSSTLPAALKDLRYVTIWLLMRSERKTPGYTNNDVYVLGNAGNPDKISLGPYNDPYRRILLNKSVEVVNFVSKN